jgi:cytochrome c-type biogenesis protein CcmH
VTRLQRLKGWPGWVVLAFVVVGFLVVGATRDGGPRTPDDRVEQISKRIACPVCDGESVFESRNPTSEGLRRAIRSDVDAGLLSDEQIIDKITSARDGQELLVPTTSGIEALAWALPATAFVIAVIGLTIAFRRWQANARRLGRATDDDYALVAEALAAEALAREPQEP